MMAFFQDNQKSWGLRLCHGEKAFSDVLWCLSWRFLCVWLSIHESWLSIHEYELTRRAAEDSSSARPSSGIQHAEEHRLREIAMDESIPAGKSMVSRHT